MPPPRRCAAWFVLVMVGCSTSGDDLGGAEGPDASGNGGPDGSAVDGNSPSPDGGPEDSGADSPSPDAEPDAGLAECTVAKATPFAIRASSWGYEIIPSVVSPGEQFSIEVTAPPGSITSLTLAGPPAALVSSSTFVDDGTGRDRVAGDGIYTLGPVHLNAPSFQQLQPGVGFLHLGKLRATLAGGTTREFLVEPAVGVLQAAGTRLPVSNNADRAATDRIVEACTSGWQGQAALRLFGVPAIADLTKSLYSVVGDNVDHWVWFSTQHLEAEVPNTATNYTAGRHYDVWVQFTGGGLSPVDARTAYGSTALRSVNFLDHGPRGVYAANVTHEILHSWGAYAWGASGMTDGAAHYNPRSSVGSLIGGFAWTPAGDGYTRDCTQGRNGANRASPWDLYFMGILPKSQVPPARIAPEDQPLAGCNQLIPLPHRTVTADDVIAAHGPVTPGPGVAPTNYRVGFAVEVAGRRLTPTEREFYHRLATAYTAPVGPGEPPYVADNWTSIAGFFPGTVWTSDLSPK